MQNIRLGFESDEQVNEYYSTSIQLQSSLIYNSVDSCINLYFTIYIVVIVYSLVESSKKLHFTGSNQEGDF